MKYTSALLALLSVGSTSAFSSPQSHAQRTFSTQLEAESSNNNLVARACATAAMTAFLWGAPGIVAEQTMSNNLPFPVETSTIANAVEKASGTGSRVNKDADSLLRYGLPIQNKEVRKLQSALETIKYDITAKRKSAALDDVKKSKSFLSGKAADKMTASCRSPKICSELLAEIDSLLEPIQVAMKQSQESFKESEQELAANDSAYAAQQKAAVALTQLEEQMIPEGYVTPVPAEYSDLAQLKKRATVKMVLKKAEDGEQFDVNGVNFPVAYMTMIIDGYAAPVTSGNFVDLVNKGFYNNMAIQRSDGFVVQTGDPEGKAVGYVGTPGKAIGAGPNGERLIPTEIFVKGDKGPFYESTIEDEARGGEATILPFSSYGAMGWAREEYDVNSGSSQFFWLLFDSDLTPAGKNVLDGRYPCFGYVVEGADFLSAIKEGDVIVSATVTEGLENLVLPKK